MKKDLIKSGVEQGYLDLLPSSRRAARAFVKKFIPSSCQAYAAIEALLNDEGDNASQARGARALAVWVKTLRYITVVEPSMNEESNSWILQAEATMVLFAQFCLGETGTISAFESFGKLSGFKQAVEDAAAAFSFNFTLEACAPFEPGGDWYFRAEGLVYDPDADEDDLWAQVPYCIGVSVGCKKDHLVERKARRAMLETCLKVASESGNGQTNVSGFWIGSGNAEPWRKMLAAMEAPKPRKQKARKRLWKKRKSRPLFADLSSA